MGAICSGDSSDKILVKKEVPSSLVTDGHFDRSVDVQTTFRNTTLDSQENISSHSILTVTHQSNQASGDDAASKDLASTEDVPIVNEAYNITNSKASSSDGLQNSAIELGDSEVKESLCLLVSDQLVTGIPEERDKMDNHPELIDVRHGFVECINLLKQIKTKGNFKEVADMMKEKMEDNSLYKYSTFEQRRQMGDYLCELG